MKRDYIIFGIVTGLVAIGSFLGGVQFQKSIKPTVSANQNTNLPTIPGGGFRRGGRPTIGTVTEVGGSSLTIKTATGAAVTVSLTSNTTISDDTGNTITVSGVKVGDSVAVVGAVASDGTITARRVRLNPPAASGANPPTGV